MLLALTLTAALLAPAPVQDGAVGASVWFVDATNSPPGTGTLADPFFSVSFAVGNQSVEPGDTILVAPGVYLNEEIDFAGKNLEVRSIDGPAHTRLIAPPQIFPFQPHAVVRAESGETRVVLDGFTLSGGTGTYSFPCAGFTERVGGAIAICGSVARIENCVFEDNESERGGSIFVRGGRLTLIDSLFSGSGSDALGQAVYVESGTALINGCTFEDLRIAPVGMPLGRGAVVIDRSVAKFSQCTFERNSTRLFGAHLWSRSSDVTVEDSTFGVSTGYAGASIAALGGHLTLRRSIIRDARSNSAPGAGLFAAGAEVSIERCLFESNAVLGPREGGAIALQSSSLYLSQSRFLSNASDRGGAIDIDLGSWGTVTDCDFTNNVADQEGGAIAVGDGFLSATRSIFQGNTAGPLARGGAVAGFAELLRCTLRGNSAGDAGGASGAALLLGSIAWDNAPTDLDAACLAVDSIVGRPGGAGLSDVIHQDPRFFGPDDANLLPGSPAIDALAPNLGLDPDQSAQEIGARTFAPDYCGDLCDLDFSSPGCSSGPNSTQRTAELFAIGSPDIERERLILTGRGFPPRQPAMLLASESGATVPLPGSTQPLCLGAPVYRLLATTTQTRPDGSFAALLPTLQGPLAGALMAGDAWHVQAWFRDPVSAGARDTGTSSSTSSSVIVFLQ